MKVLVTGGAGQIGTYVVARLKDNHDVTILDIKPSTVFPEVPFLEVDLTDRTQTEQVSGFDVVVHLAGIPNPFSDTGDRILSVNLAGTYNLLEAVRVHGVRRIIYGGSESESGYGIHTYPLQPDYLPIDEQHACRCHEAYSFSKYFNEFMCQEYARAYQIEMVALRYCWVWLDAFRAEIEEILSEDVFGDQSKNWFGGYIFPEDVAQAIELALDYQLPDPAFPFDLFYLAGPTTSFEANTLTCVEKTFEGSPPPVRDMSYFIDNPHAPFFDIRKAKKLLGFNPQFGKDDLDHPDRVRFGQTD